MDIFPPLNAALNAISAALLLAAFVLIRRGRFRAHAWTMGAALLTSVVFLACYLAYHELKRRSGAALTRFPEGPWRPVYLAVLLSHTVLAVVILPLIGLTLAAAGRRRWARHRWIARPTLALWFYVSGTGVLIYWMLYHLAPALSHR